MLESVMSIDMSVGCSVDSGHQSQAHTYAYTSTDSATKSNKISSMQKSHFTHMLNSQ